jgi:hypothetical protein
VNFPNLRAMRLLRPKLGSWSHRERPEIANAAECPPPKTLSRPAIASISHARHASIVNRDDGLGSRVPQIKNAREMVTIARRGKWAVDGVSGRDITKYAKAYVTASKKDKGLILDQVISVTGRSRDNSRRRVAEASKRPPGVGASRRVGVRA